MSGTFLEDNLSRSPLIVIILLTYGVCEPVAGTPRSPAGIDHVNFCLNLNKILLNTEKSKRMAPSWFSPHTPPSVG
jgi:hypothetical protein